MVSVIEVRL